MVEYEISHGQFISCEIVGRTETVGQYRCRYIGVNGANKIAVVDSHKLRDPQRPVSPRTAMTLKEKMSLVQDLGFAKGVLRGIKAHSTDDHTKIVAAEALERLEQISQAIITAYCSETRQGTAR